MDSNPDQFTHLMKISSPPSSCLLTVDLSRGTEFDARVDHPAITSGYKFSTIDKESQRDALNLRAS